MITAAAPSDNPKTPKLYADSILIPSEVRLTSPTFDLMLETSFCNEERAFFKAPISCPEAELDEGGKSSTDVLSTSSIGTMTSTGVPLRSPFT